MITAFYHNPETDEDVPFYDFMGDGLELVMPWVKDQFHDLEDHLVLETRHLQAFSYFLTRICKSKSKYVGGLREFLILSWFLKSNLGWQIHLEMS